MTDNTVLELIKQISDLKNRVASLEGQDSNKIVMLPGVCRVYDSGVATVTGPFSTNVTITNATSTVNSITVTMPAKVNGIFYGIYAMSNTAATRIDMGVQNPDYPTNARNLAFYAVNVSDRFAGGGATGVSSTGQIQLQLFLGQTNRLILDVFGYMV